MNGRGPACVAVFLGGLLASAAPASALEVVRSRDVAAAPGAVWALIGGFCAIALWHPQVERCIAYDQDAEKSDGRRAERQSGDRRNGIGTDPDDDGGAPVRGLVVSGGLGTLVEVETARDEARMTYSYAFVSGPLPVSAYNATILVRPNGTGSTVIWMARFDASGMGDEAARADIEGVYEAGLAGIAREVSR